MPNYTFGDFRKEQKIRSATEVSPGVFADNVCVLAGAGGSDVAAAWATGRKSLIGTTALQLVAAATPATKGVVVKAAAGNSGTVYVGVATVTADAADATDGFPLAAGEPLTVPVDDVSKVWVRATVADQKVFWAVA